MMDNLNSNLMEEGEPGPPDRPSKAQSEDIDSGPRWSNGQCVMSIMSSSIMRPTFDLAHCSDQLAREGFQQIPDQDLETPLRAALDSPAVRRYLVFNSTLFHLIMAPMLYLVLWCAVFSTLHLYISVTEYWVLCLCVSLISIFLTTAIIFFLHRSNNTINMNIDVRLIQLYFVYWDMTRCLRSLTQTFEEQSFIENNVQNKLKRRMSHLVLVADVAATEADRSEVEQGPDEHRPLLGNEGGSSSQSSPHNDPKITMNYSLIPDALLPPQAKAYQLLMTYSAVYVKLLMSERLSGPSHHRLRACRNHCTTAPFCLCQYIKTKIIR
ncbi:transmembrane protein 268 isoform X3 [Synchiropus splendidus]|uniref:transmembrane protein 268 isoform X3 n=1 Tax=Synchiropus splendidus TaxID=270530 RepID=UPI00237D6255|nr:transmembrane protein 268 isoform X3 [Synchiropus splendidus]